jgi:hypothetical protein
MKIPRRAKLIVALALWIPSVSFLAYVFLYEPVKFRYLIHRVESAKTPAEERAAFMLAKRWGRVWEVNLREPPRDWFDYKQLDAAVRDPQRTLALELEWLESKPSGVPFRACRTITDKSNIYVLLSR